MRGSVGEGPETRRGREEKERGGGGVEGWERREGRKGGYILLN